MTDRRDGAVAILTDQNIQNAVLKPNNWVVFDAYQAAILTQTEQNDPRFGSINALLRVGQAIAPIFHLARSRGRKTEAVISSWKDLAQKFPDEDQFYIHAELLKIEEGILPRKSDRRPHITQKQKHRLQPVISQPVNVREKRSRVLDADQAKGLRSLMKRLGFTQQDLAPLAHVSQSWVSNLLNTVTPIREVQAVEALVRELRRVVTAKEYRRQLTNSEVTGGNQLLNGILAKFGIDYLSGLAEPVGSIPVDVKNYLHRRDEERAVRRVLMNDAGAYRFLLMVTGPPDSGKGSLVSFLCNIADLQGVYVQGVYVNSINFIILAGSGNSEAVEEALVANYVIKSLAARWHLAVPESGDMSRIGDIAIWYDHAIRKVPQGDKQLFIFEGIDALQHEIVKARLLLLLESLQPHQLNSPAGSAFVLVVTPETLALQRELEESRIYHNAVRVGWFDLDQAKELTAVLEIPNAEQLSHELFQQYGGQPALTHIAAMLIRDNPELTPDQIYQMALAGKGQFFGHINKIRELVYHLPEISLYGEPISIYGLELANHIAQEGIDLSALDISREQVNYFLGLGLFEIKEENGKSLLKPKTKFYRDLFSTYRRVAP